MSFDWLKDVDENEFDKLTEATVGQRARYDWDAVHKVIVGKKVTVNDVIRVTKELNGEEPSRQPVLKFLERLVKEGKAKAFLNPTGRGYLFAVLR